jgi:hypothetical protein
LTEKQTETSAVRRALRWWGKWAYVGRRVPPAHYSTLKQAGYLDCSEEGNGEVSLTNEGRAAMRALGFRDNGFGQWEQVTP